MRMRAVLVGEVCTGLQRKLDELGAPADNKAKAVS